MKFFRKLFGRKHSKTNQHVAPVPPAPVPPAVRDRVVVEPFTGDTAFAEPEDPELADMACTAFQENATAAEGVAFEALPPPDEPEREEEPEPVPAPDEERLAEARAALEQIERGLRELESRRTADLEELQRNFEIQNAAGLSPDAEAALAEELTARKAELEQAFTEQRDELEWKRITWQATLEEAEGASQPRSAKSVYVTSVYESAYGGDSRMDFHQLADEALLKEKTGNYPISLEQLENWKNLSRSVCLVTYRLEAQPAATIGVTKEGKLKGHLLAGKQVVKNGSPVTIDGRPAVEWQPSHVPGPDTWVPGDGEPFRDQKCVGFGTGFLVAPDVIVTAGHVVPKDTWLPYVAFTFGYRMTSAEQPAQVDVATIRYPASGPGTLIRPASGGLLGDCSVIKLDRPVPPEVAVPLEIETHPVAPWTYLGVWGHPCGLPMKSVFGKKCRYRAKFLDQGIFAGLVSSVDTFKGNSGSPVFAMDTGKVVGILIGGGTDFAGTSDRKFKSVTYETAAPREQILATDHFSPLIDRAVVV